MKFINQVKNLIYQTDGKFTEELKLDEATLGLGYLPKRMHPEKTIQSVCGYCSTGCSLDIHIKNGEAVNITPTHNYSVNLGSACPKGWEALAPLKAQDRATTPYLQKEPGQLTPIDWQTALEIFVNRFTALQDQYGKESVAFLSTGQIPTEEMAFLGALAKFGMGMVHGDSNTRQCMATAAVAYKESFGFDAPPYTYTDFEESDVLIFVGANPCIAHPIMWEHVGRNPHQPKIVVVDPRKTETAMAATHHYALQPKSDLILFYGLAHVLIRNQWLDEQYIAEHTSGFDDFAAHVEIYTPEYVSQKTGLSQEQIYDCAEMIHKGQRVSFWWTMGVNQSYQGVRTAQALINLALMTGNMGRPGTGANSITGQCNAMGSRLYSNTTNLLGGHDFTNPEHRKKIADILDIDVERIPQKNTWAYDQIIEGIGSGKIKGLWVIATNPAHSWINQNDLKDVFGNLEFLVVQDMYHSTETAQLADLILPSAGWGEKDGTFINSERRIGRIKKAAKAPGQALADFYIFKLIAKYWGCNRMFEQWEKPEDVFQVIKKISKGQPCDITGIKDYQMLDEYGGIQWPCPEGYALENNQRCLFEDGQYYHEDKKAKFIFAYNQPNPEPVTEEYPFSLLTGRGSSSQWHTQTRTSKSAVLRKLYPQEIYVEISTADAHRLNIEHCEVVFVRTRRGRLKAKAVIAPHVNTGQIFIPMHYKETNQLTLSSFDPYSRQPSYKICAARLEKHDR